MAKQPATPKRPNLRASEWTDEALERDAEVSVPRDVDASKAWVREHAPPGYKGLLDAVPDEPDA